MKILTVLVIFGLHLTQIIDSVIYRAAFLDELLKYEVDSSVAPLTNFFDMSNLHLEQIDDDNVEIGGYLECIKSMDSKLPLAVAIRTQRFDKGTWSDGHIRLWVPHICPEFLNTERFWYNVTKLWTRCPAQKGDKWNIELQSVEILFNFPPSIRPALAKGFLLWTQGWLGMEVTKFGFGVQLELVAIR